MVDNFNRIIKLLTFDSEDDFYHLQIIKRKKDNEGLAGRNNNARCVKTYYISSLQYLIDKKEEIIDFCTVHNARACINLNRRSFEKVAYQMLIKITGQIISKDFNSVRRAYESVCGNHSNEPHKKWILDIDDKEFNSSVIDEFIYSIEPIGNKIIAYIPTKNGYHLISKPFNIQAFRNIQETLKFPPIDIHKDNPTILYIP